MSISTDNIACNNYRETRSAEIDSCFILIFFRPGPNWCPFAAMHQQSINYVILRWLSRNQQQCRSIIITVITAASTWYTGATAFIASASLRNEYCACLSLNSADEMTRKFIFAKTERLCFAPVLYNHWKTLVQTRVAATRRKYISSLVLGSTRKKYSDISSSLPLNFTEA